VRMNIVTEDMLVKALSKQLNLPTVNLDAITSVPPHVRAKLPIDMARDLQALPIQLRDDGKTLVVVMSEPQNLKHLDTLRAVSRCRIMPQLAGRQAIARAFSRVYDGESEAGADVESSFKLVDSQGHTLIKSVEEVEKQRAAQAPKKPAAPRPAVPAAVPSSSSRSPAEQLRAIEDAQRKEVAALKAMVELMIEKGVFSREEYLSRVKRSAPSA
jgi:hypothetical protein